MREILFRGKRLDNGEWVMSGNIIHFNEDNLFYIAKQNDKCIHLDDVNDNILQIEEGTFYKVDPATVGQYTGLTANGKKIFEGDIIKIEHSDYAFDGMSLEYRTERGAVAYNDWGMVGIVVEKYKGQNVWSDFFLVAELTDIIESWTFEILGNIHDNPELLKGGAKE